MISCSVFYPAVEGARFDTDYYDATHIPLVRSAFTSTGLTDVQVFYGLSSGDGGPPAFVAMAHLSFESRDALKARLGGPRASEVLSDVGRFTDIQQQIQISTLPPAPGPLS